MRTKKQQVIDTAVLLFAKYGYRQICVDRICEESNVSKMTVYKYFPTKELIFEAALEERNRTFIESLSETISDKVSPVEKLKAVFRYYHSWFNHEDFSGCMFINSMSFFSDTNETVLKFVRLNKTMIQQILDGIICPLIGTDECNDTTSQIVKLLDGAIVSAQVGMEEDPANSAWLASASLLSAQGANIEVASL